MSQLDRLQKRTLEKKLLTLQRDLKRMLQMDASSAATVELDQSKIGRLTRMDALQTQAIVQVTQAQHRTQLRMISEALQAMKSGDYGYCEICGESIPYERLSIKPETRYCVSCQQKSET